MFAAAVMSTLINTSTHFKVIKCLIRWLTEFRICKVYRPTGFHDQKSIKIDCEPNIGNNFLFSLGSMMKPARLDYARKSLVQVRKMYRIVGGGRIPIILVINGDGFYHTVWQYRRFPIMGNFFFEPFFFYIFLLPFQFFVSFFHFTFNSWWSIIASFDKECMVSSVLTSMYLSCK